MPQVRSYVCSLWLVIVLVLLNACQEPTAVTRPTATAVFRTPTTASAVTPVTPTASPPTEKTGAATTANPATAETDRQAATKLGVHLLLDDGRNQWPMERWSEHMRYARQAVGAGGYVVQLVRDDDLDLIRWQRFMDLCAEHQLIPIIRLATTFDRNAGWWRAPAADGNGRYHEIAARYAAFLGALRWPTNQHYVIIANEPNRGDEWGGRPDPAAYAQFLLDVAGAIRDRDSNAVILNAGLDLFAPHSGSRPAFDGKYYMDAESFLDQMHAAHPEVFSAIDVWSSHAYPLGPFTAPPWQQTFAVDLLNDAVNPAHIEPPQHVHNRGINGYAWELFKLSTYGVSLPVMITETGWRHAESIAHAAKDTGKALPDAETTAAFLDLALRGNHGRYPDFPEQGWTPWLSDPRVVAVTPFAFNGHPSEWGHTNWLILDPQGAVVGTYPAFARLAMGNARLSGRQD